MPSPEYGCHRRAVNMTHKGGLAMKSGSGRGEMARRFELRILLLVGISVLFSGCQTIKQIIYTHDPLNFHTVEKDVLYRSAQPTGGDLEMIVNKHGIKSVINLRGAGPGQNWYDNELIVSEQYGLKRVDISMSAERLPHKRDLVKLLDAFRDLPKPILVHCRAGADRTGEAAAIFAFDHMKMSRSEASGQLHPYFGHVPDLYPAKTYFFNKVYEGEKWARESYDPCRADYPYYDKADDCGAAPAPDTSGAVRPAPAPAAPSPPAVKRRINDER
jgi:protein tyrosine phosphatase (PTP) superfamily phosphohydrolase (DUF442 family)